METINKIVKSAFPGVVLSGELASRSTEESIALAREYIEQTYPGCRSAILFGSFTRGEQHAFSDLDMLVILDKLPNGTIPVLERHIHQGMRIEIFLFTEKDLCQTLHEYRNIGLGVFRDALTEGVHITGDSQLSARLKAMAQERRFDPRPAADDHYELLHVRVRITLLLIKLTMAKDLYSRIHIAYMIYHGVCKSIVFKEQGDDIGIERFAKFFDAHDPELAKILQAEFISICAGGPIENFVDICGQCLDRVGGPIWNGITQPMRAERPRFPFLRAIMRSFKARMLPSAA